MTRTLAVMIAALVSMSQGMALADDAGALELKWSELEAHVAGRRVEMVLPAGARIEGKVLQVAPDGLRMRVRKTSDRSVQPKGEALIARQSVSVLHVTEYHKLGRLIFGLGLPLAIAAIVASKTPWTEEGATIPLAAGVGGGAVIGGAIGGYYIGKSIDRHVTEIRIARD
ncbi:MAG TPA: hypothetical protein VG675_11510 [Bryobacteraceae bacterium]|nr:hypothetical protein [Bryobacteraceae bacterium]